MELAEDEVSKECAHGVITQLGASRTPRQYLHLCTVAGCVCSQEEFRQVCFKRRSGEGCSA